ncbi:MAG: hypothetical protein ACYDB2_03630 [Acidimicrobiales bacterium]
MGRLAGNTLACRSTSTSFSVTMLLAQRSVEFDIKEWSLRTSWDPIARHVAMVRVRNIPRVVTCSAFAER